MNTISICMIVKNEENILEDCLSMVENIGDELIIIDTGSTDNTKTIAKKYTNKVYDYEWKNDFSDARNYSISKANNEYILVLDADEIIENFNEIAFEELIVEPYKIGRLLRINEYSRQGVPYKFHERVGRLFSKNNYKYEGIIHEQLVPMNHIKTEYYDIPLTASHSGYEGDLETRKKKTDRNIELLKNALKENPEDPYVIYQIGKSYYMEENYELACKYLSSALGYDLDTRLEYVQDAVESYGYSLLNSKQFDVAMQLTNVYDEFAHSADFIFMIALVLMNNGKFAEAVEEFSKATKKKECKMEGVNTYLSYYNIGIIFECLGDSLKAIKYYERCGYYHLAKQRLQLLK